VDALRCGRLHHLQHHRQHYSAADHDHDDSAADHDHDDSAADHDYSAADHDDDRPADGDHRTKRTQRCDGDPWERPGGRVLDCSAQ
jgi:hypothetical protein